MGLGVVNAGATRVQGGGDECGEGRECDGEKEEEKEKGTTQTIEESSTGEKDTS